MLAFNVEINSFIVRIAFGRRSLDPLPTMNVPTDPADAHIGFLRPFHKYMDRSVSRPELINFRDVDFRIIEPKGAVESSNSVRSRRKCCLSVDLLLFWRDSK